jgi:hypothetical protein
LRLLDRLANAGKWLEKVEVVRQIGQPLADEGRVASAGGAGRQPMATHAEDGQWPDAPVLWI